MPYYGAAYGQEHPRGTLILILGIVSLVVCSLLGPFAWVMGRKALKEIDAGGVPVSNRGQVQAGMICGIVSSALMILGLLYVLVVVIIAVSSSR
jgi:phosphotransferase system  glucose/maltose/N-acetylglucosamine-specific IIC component